jgi:CubicO group peptidase (beta-lactamase class C family)
MTTALSRRGLLAAVGALAASPALAEDPPLKDVLDYAREQKTTGFLIVRDRKTLAERNWAPGPDASAFRAFAYETTPEGALLEDVASQQKSFVSMLAAIAIDKNLLDVERPVSDHLGSGWSKATPEQERAIRVIHLLTMSSGLTEKFAYEAPAGSRFFYNTSVYAVMKPVLAAWPSSPLRRLPLSG